MTNYGPPHQNQERAGQANDWQKKKEPGKSSLQK
jgi:hypothetical protein